MTGLTERPTSLDQIPLLLTPLDVATICAVKLDYVQHNPKLFGLAKRKGMGLRVTRAAFLRKQGLADLGSLK